MSTSNLNKKRKRTQDDTSESESAVEKKNPWYSITPTPVRNPDKKALRIYADGVYDMFHYGHARSLEQAKTLFPNTYLIVGVTSDADTWKHKGKTLFDEKERAEMVSHCRFVDEVVACCPWEITQEFIDEYEIDYVVHGEDFCANENGEDVYGFVKSIGKFKTIKRTDGVSTSDLIMRILRNYGEYVRRNLRRGYKPQDIGLSFMAAQQIKLEDTWSAVTGFVGSIFGGGNKSSDVPPAKRQKTAETAEETNASKHK